MWVHACAFTWAHPLCDSSLLLEKGSLLEPGARLAASKPP